MNPHQPDPGTTPDPIEQDLPLRRSMSPMKLALQAVGGLVGIGMLVWCVKIAMSENNQAALKRLADADASDLAMLLGLSLLAVLVAGETFRRVLMPVQRLPVVRTHATNAIASVLALLPFKLSIVFRVLVHNRRDGVGLLTIGAWFAAVAVVILTVLVPVMLASWWRGKADTLWLVSVGVGVLVSAGSLLAVARWISSKRGWAMVQKLWHAMPFPRVIKNSTLLDRAHEGLRMLSHPATLAQCVALRLIDIACQTGRVFLAAKILGLGLTWDQAAVAGSVYFLVGALAPTGQAGAREGLTAVIAAAVLAGHDMNDFAVIVLPISVSELLVLLVLSVLGMPVVRPDKLMLGKHGSPERDARSATR